MDNVIQVLEGLDNLGCACESKPMTYGRQVNGLGALGVAEEICVSSVIPEFAKTIHGQPGMVRVKDAQRYGLSGFEDTPWYVYAGAGAAVLVVGGLLYARSVRKKVRRASGLDGVKSRRRRRRSL